MASLRRLMSAFNLAAKPSCPSCGEWTTWIVDEHWTVPIERPRGTPPRDDAHETFDRDPSTLVLVCEKCGFIRMHARDVLERIDVGPAE
jgi:hypothetical protein